MTNTANILQELVTDLKNPGGIEACTIVSRDGLLMSSDIPGGIMDETFTAMFATMLEAAETATTQLDKVLSGRIIVEWHNRTIWARSIPGKGCVFHIILPVMQPNTSS
ncbi:MAG: hypothetical protein HF976_05140 [ANME-2 cluster archaeon]|nr:hypothetical protein [ANME-2 cluster archaeon]MBC2700791.1 hypothetical protein [ANME-2 cluster archaeon]MBC2707540.1 hypothetical protein [ANME-2 cluster archaeon]MBC2745885.1 hypothetical protein [ANME-2 cluster archaeon]MBC2763260.1 hypothetical protein [ANME-2 cluster archaeon]